MFRYVSSATELPPTPGSGPDTLSIVGKHCESGDILIRDARINCLPVDGDILAVFCTGAYNSAMSSNYNKLTRPAAVMVKNGDATLVLERETDEDLLRHDVPLAKLSGLFD